jgi:hypothetical protein
MITIEFDIRIALSNTGKENGDRPVGVRPRQNVLVDGLCLGRIPVAFTIG